MGSNIARSQGHGESQVSPTKSIPAKEKEEGVRKDFDKMFADMEFRCKRSAMMNYFEAERYDFWSRMLQAASATVGALGVSGIGASVAKTNRVAASSAGLAGVLALPLCGVLQFLSNGSSSLAPTVAEKAKLHVQAGAGWQRIGRLSRSYRMQLRHLEPGTVDVSALSLWYRELVEECEIVSRLVPIRADTYMKFEQPENVVTRMSQREHLLQRFMEQEEHPLPFSSGTDKGSGTSAGPHVTYRTAGRYL